MLDCHPAVTGIGEWEGVRLLSDAAIASGHWPENSLSTPQSLLQAWQSSYLTEAEFLRGSNAIWSLDKSLDSWQWLPLLSITVPGAALISIFRDSRDMAISMLLGNFHPTTFGWTGSLDSIYRDVSTHRRLLPAAVASFGMPSLTVKYEHLVEHPHEVMERCSQLLGISFDPATLAPEANQRTVLTLSHEQVRRPINRDSIGRWKHYEWIFDDRWTDLAASHIA